MKSIKKYIHHLKNSNKETKNVHALSWAFIFTLMIVVIYCYFFYNTTKSNIIILDNTKRNDTKLIDDKSINQIQKSWNELSNIFSDNKNKNTSTEDNNKNIKMTDIIYNYDKKSIKLGSDTYDLYIADTNNKRVLGLSGTKSLCDKCGLLFIFDNEDYLGFWMKDMFFNIDIIFLDKNGYIIDIYKDLSPQSYPKVFYSSQLARYVIELKSGDSTKINLQKGDKIDF